MWWVDDGTFTLVAGAPCEEPLIRFGPNGVESTTPERLVAPVPDVDGYYVECGPLPSGPRNVEVVGRLLARLLGAERDTLRVAEELAARYEEIDLLYTISEILGRTIRLEEAAEVIVREVSSVVGARRASIFVHDERPAVLRPVAGWGIDVGEFGPIPVSHPTSIASRAFRECRAIAGRSTEFDTSARPPRLQRYRGTAFLSVPIVYPDSSGRPRPVGVINLTDRLGADAFSTGHRKMVEAIAHQIGAAIENARLVAIERHQQRVRRELELAHDLQLRLLPGPDVLGDPERISARCEPGELVGGDLYQFVPLPGDQCGVMLGDVSGRGFPAALIMALVLSAAGIQAAAAESPEVALERLLASVQSELSTTEMFLTLFYGVVDRKARVIRFANAGHPHAFLINGRGAVRLKSTAPPLGLANEQPIPGDRVSFEGDDNVLLLFSDGIADAHTGNGDVFGEDRVVQLVRSKLHRPAREIVNAVFAAVAEYSQPAADDQTLLVLKV